MKQVFLEEGLESIEEKAFENNIGLSTVILPNSVKNVDPTAFPK